MYTVFSVNRSDNIGAIPRMLTMVGKPVIKINDFSKFSGRLNKSELMLPKNMDAAHYKKLVSRSFEKLKLSGIKKIVLPKGFDGARAASFGMYEPDISRVYFAKTEEIIERAVLFTQNCLRDMKCFVYAEGLTPDVKRVIFYLMLRTKHIMVDCGDETEDICNEVLSEYGVPMDSSFERDDKKVIAILFSPIDNKRLRFIAPDVVISLCSRRLCGINNSFIVSGAEISSSEEIFNELPEDSDKKMAIALFYENGWISPQKIDIGNIKYEYNF